MRKLNYLCPTCDLRQRSANYVTQAQPSPPPGEGDGATGWQPRSMGLHDSAGLRGEQLWHSRRKSRTAQVPHLQKQIRETAPCLCSGPHWLSLQQESSERGQLCATPWGPGMILLLALIHGYQSLTTKSHQITSFGQVEISVYGKA